MNGQSNKWIIAAIGVVLALFVIFPWVKGKYEKHLEEEAQEKALAQKQFREGAKRTRAENAAAMAAENEMLVMDAENGMRFGMTESQLEKHIVSMVRSGKMDDNNTMPFRLQNGKEVLGNFESHCAYGVLYKYELEFFNGPDGNNITKDDYYEIVKTIDSNHTGYQRYQFDQPEGLDGTFWIKDNMVIECYFDDMDPMTVTLSYENEPIAYNVMNGNDDYVKRLCKTMQPQRDAHVHNSKYGGGVVMEVKEYMQDRGSYEPVEWGPVVKKNNAYYVRHMYYTWNVAHEKVLNNCMFRMDLDGEVTDVYAIRGTTYVYQ